MANGANDLVYFPREKHFFRSTQIKEEQEGIPPLKNFQTSIPTISSANFGYSDIEKIYIGPCLEFAMAKIWIEKLLVDSGVSETDLANIQILPSERPFK